MQQFLADSPWDPALLVRAVAERVAPVIEAEAWVLDDTGFPKDGKRLAGGQAPVLRDAGEDRQLPDRGVAARGGPRGRCRWAGRCTCRRTGVRTRSAAARRRSPRSVAFQTKPELGVELIERAAGWEMPARRCSATAPMAITPSCARGLTATARVRASIAPDTTMFAPETVFVVPERANPGRSPEDRPAAGPQAASDRRADRPPGRRVFADRHLPRRPRRRTGDLPVSRSCA